MMNFITKSWEKVIGILLAGWIFYFFAHFFYASLIEKNDTHLDNISNKSVDRVVVKGLRINESKGGRPFFTAEIGQIRFENKKIGFIKFGMLPVAVVEGFKLTVFDNDVEGKQTTPSPSSISDISHLMKNPSFSNKSSQKSKLHTFSELEKYISDPEFFKLFKLDRAHNIRFEQFQFRFVKNNKEALKVHCLRLIPEFKNNLLKLSGNVSITTENKKIEGETIYFDWKKQRFISDKDYRLIRDKYTVTRRKLDTDIFLSSL